MNDFREGDLVYRKVNPPRIGRLWDGELDHKGNAYVEWQDTWTLQVVPAADLVVLTADERSAYESGQAS